jgi:hypothetical protein
VLYATLFLKFENKNLIANATSRGKKVSQMFKAIKSAVAR